MVKRQTDMLTKRRALAIMAVVYITIIIAGSISLRNIDHNVTDYITPQFVQKVMQDRILYKLMMCESGGKKHAVNYNDGAVGLHSYGYYQFQIPTLKELWYRKTGERITSQQAIAIATDYDLSTALARYTWFELGESRRWFNCKRKIEA